MNESNSEMAGENKKVYRETGRFWREIMDRFEGELSVSEQFVTPAASADQLHKRDVSRAAGDSRVLGSCRTGKTLLRRRRRRVVTTADYPTHELARLVTSIETSISDIQSDVTLLQPYNHIFLLAEPQIACPPCAVLVRQLQLEASQDLGCQLVQLSKRDILADASS